MNDSHMKTVERLVNLFVITFGTIVCVLFVAYGHIIVGLLTLAYYIWAIPAAKTFALAHSSRDENDLRIRRIAGRIFSLPVGLGIAGCAYFISQGQIGMGILMFILGVVGNIFIHSTWNRIALRFYR